MFCKNCGTQQRDGARFCPNCGAAQPEIPAPPPVQEFAPTPVQPITPPVQEITPPPATFADKVLAAAKRIGSSPKFLIATICLTLVQVLGLFALNTNADTFRAVSDLFDELHIDAEEVAELLSAFEDAGFLFGLMGMLPGLVITAGLWIIYGTCSGNSKRINTSGLTMIFVVNLIQMVVACLALLAALLPIIVTFASLDNVAAYTDTDLLETALTVSLVMILIVLGVILLYYIKLCSTLSTVKYTLQSGVPNFRVSGFVGVMCYILGGIAACSGLTNLLSAGIAPDILSDHEEFSDIFGAIQSNAYLTAFSSLLSGIAQLFFGALLFTYKNQMQNLSTEAVYLASQRIAPVYQPPVQTPQAPPVYTVSQQPESVPTPATEETN